MWWWAHWTGCMRYLSPMRIWSPLALERRRVGFIAHKSRKPWACCSFSRLRTLGDLILLLQHSTLYSPKSLLFMKIFQQNQRKSSHVCAHAKHCLLFLIARFELLVSYIWKYPTNFISHAFTKYIFHVYNNRRNGLLVLYLEVNILI